MAACAYQWIRLSKESHKIKLITYESGEKESKSSAELGGNKKRNNFLKSESLCNCAAAEYKCGPYLVLNIEHRIQLSFASDHINIISYSESAIKINRFVFNHSLRWWLSVDSLIGPAINHTISELKWSSKCVKKWFDFEWQFKMFPFQKFCSSVERRILSAGKTCLCFVVFLICIQPLLFCYFGKLFFI